MYRVELKAKSEMFITVLVYVPNVPCGVERYLPFPISRRTERFLMYRVELKVIKIHTYTAFSFYTVPNVPCGVERKIFQFVSMFRWLF